MLDAIGHDLPSLLEDPGFRPYVRSLRVPAWPEDRLRQETLAELRLYYVRLGFLASAYVNQVSQPRADTLPHNIAVPLCKACALLERPPILSYDGYALYNWKRIDATGPIALGNIDTLQDFVHLYDEHWFILVHVEIEAIGAHVLAGMDRAARAFQSRDASGLSLALREIAAAVWRYGIRNGFGDVVQAQQILVATEQRTADVQRALAALAEQIAQLRSAVTEVDDINRVIEKAFADET